MDKLNCCVIDDEPLAGQLIQSYIEQIPFCTCAGMFTSAQDAIRPIMQGKIDVVYLDIQMPQISGIEFAKIIPPEVKVVFTTAYEQHAIEGFRVNALDYLLKPISYNEFLQSANRALRWKLNHIAAKEHYKETAPDHLIVRSDYKLLQIQLSNILFIEGLKDYIKIYLASGGPCIMTLMNLKSIESALPQPQFLRVHRSYIVNTSHIKSIERSQIILDRKSIPISETYRQSFIEYVNSRSVPTLPINNV